MAARLRFGLSICCRASRSIRGSASPARLLINNERLLAGYRNFAVNELVSVKRFYAGSSDAISSAGVNVALKAENVDSGNVTQGSTTAASTEGEDDEDPFMKELVRRYDMGRRWLAKIMGEDPENFSEKDVKEAIQYLMPSGLYARDTRPSLLHPSKMYPRSKAAKFDQTGRPVSPAFYTGQVAYHDLIYEIYKQADKLTSIAASDQVLVQQLGHSDVQLKQKETADGNLPRVMRWIRKEELEKKLQEHISTKQYEKVIFRLKKLANQPGAQFVQDFLDEFRHPVSLPGIKKIDKKLDDQGRANATGHRKRAIAEVWLKEGSGEITVNDRPFLKYFTRTGDRQQIMFPFLVVDQVGQYDVECQVIGGGPTGQAGAARLAISRALLSISDSFAEPLQEAGLLIRDPRIAERKKPGQKKARKKFAWVKR